MNCANQNYSSIFGAYIGGPNTACAPQTPGGANAGIFPPQPGGPMMIGALSSPLGGPSYTAGEFRNRQTFLGGNDQQMCVSINPASGTWYTFAFGSSQCGTTTTWGLGWNAIDSYWAWRFSVGVPIMMYTNDTYRGYPTPNGGVQFPVGLLLGNDSNYLGQEREIESRPGAVRSVFTNHLRGDVSINTLPSPGGNLFWTYTPSFTTTLAGAVTSGTTTSVPVAACPSPVLPAGAGINRLAEGVIENAIFLDAVMGTLASCSGTTLTFNNPAAVNGVAGDTIQFMQWYPSGRIANDPDGTSWPALGKATNVASLVACNENTIGFGIVKDGATTKAAPNGDAVKATGSSVRPVFCDGTSWTYH